MPPRVLVRVTGICAGIILVLAIGLVGCSKQAPAPVACESSTSDTKQKVRVDSSAGNPGCVAHVTVAGSACPPQVFSSGREEFASTRPQPVVVQWDGIPSQQLAQAQSSSVEESLTLTIVIPADGKPGAHKIVVVCGQPMRVQWSFEFIVIKATLTLEPASGVPGDSVRLSGSGIRCGKNIVIEWGAPGGRTVGEVKPDKPWGGFVLTFTVPADASPQAGADLPVEVGARCADEPKTRPAKQTFTIKAPPPPSLKVRAGTLQKGSPITLVGEGKGCAKADAAAEIVPLFDDKPQPHAKVLVPSPYQPFEVTFAVPDTAAGEHKVNVRCDWETAGSPQLAQTVVVQEATEVPPVVLGVNPGRGWRGRQVTVSASGVDCAAGSPSVLVAIVDAAEVGRSQVPAVSATTTYTFIASIPAKAAAGEHTLQVRCAWAPAGTVLSAASLRVDVPELRADPRTSRAGGQVAVSAKGFDCSTPAGSGMLTVRWGDGKELASLTSSTPEENLTSNATIPEAIGRGVVTLTARCATEATQQATTELGIAGITLTPAQGVLGTKITAAGDGFVCDQVTIRWDDGPATRVTAARGHFEQELPVQREKSGDGKHTVTAMCDKLEVPQTFTMRAPTVSVAPASAPVGEKVTVQGAFYSPLCQRYELRLAGRTVASSLTTRDAGPDGQTVSTEITVPEWAGEGRSVVELQCDDQAGAQLQVEQVAFEVPGDSPGWPLWVVITVIGVLVVLAAVRKWLWPRPQPAGAGPPLDNGPAQTTQQHHPGAHPDIEVLVIESGPRPGSSAWGVPLRSHGHANGNIRIVGGRQTP